MFCVNRCRPFVKSLAKTIFDSEIEDYRSRTKKLKAPKEVKDKLNKEIDRLEGLSSNSSEGSVSRGYIDTLLELPWNKSSKDNLDIKEAKQILEDDHYGLSDGQEACS